MHEKTMTPRSCLRWKPTGRIFNTVGLRWVPTRKILTSSTTKVDSTSINVQEEQTLDLSAGTPFNLKNERIKAWIKENVISGRPMLHGIALIQEISTRPSSQGIRILRTSKHGESNNTYELEGSYAFKVETLSRLSSKLNCLSQYEHVGQDSRSQDEKDVKDKQGKDLKISELKTKSKDNEKGSRSKIA
ncbi:hypothetical protein Tco_0415225 [Tanacetum coccineum]